MAFTTQKFIDRYVGNTICAVLMHRKRPLETNKILIVKLWALGESILVLPLIKGLRQKYPNAQIDVLCTTRNKTAFEGHVNNIIILGKGNALDYNKYDVAIDCEPYLNLSGIMAYWMAKNAIGFDHGMRKRCYTYKIKFNDEQHEVLTYMELGKVLGVDYKPKKLEPIKYSPEDKKKVDVLIKGFGKIAAICAGAAESGRSRLWAKEKYAELADKLVSQKFTVLFTGVERERPLIDEIIALMKNKKALNFAGKTNIRELAYMLTKCEMLISNDTGTMHLGAAMGTPTVGLFCPNTPVRFAPYGPKNTYVFKPVMPKPCINVHKGEVPDCEGHNHMSNITVKDVLEAIKCLKH